MVPKLVSNSSANEVLERAVTIAQSNADLPAEWLEAARSVFRLSAKTYTPALGTLLLAKATDSTVDALSIKATGENGYSIRTLGHNVLVPASVRYGFSIRTTGREPLNNQPFFRYEHMREIDRVLNKEQFDVFLTIAKRANKLPGDATLFALAAFLRVAFNETNKVSKIVLKEGDLSAAGIENATANFLRQSAPERPRRLQAFAAACLDLGHYDVRSRRINDPSRDVPGDVQAYWNDAPYLSMEVRGKAVPETEISAFAESCFRAGISRVIIFVDWRGHEHIEPSEVTSQTVQNEHVLLSIFESCRDLVREALTWADLPLLAATAHLRERVFERLSEIESMPETLQDWASLVAEETFK